ncbi:MAG TPA: hypothetical protein PLA43_01740 [Bryobacteraceae bacterium]|nr:hypothetical protein [Bryobacteraceae bacterium]HOQ44331.1 hypothetical protein [Bryobacteraceae bacterium]HPU70649.1 hypothetical protein [Bryobacteraceae bacterium]
MLPTLILAGVLCLVGAAQNTPTPLTAEQILEKSIEASGGRKAMEELTSTVAKGILEIIAPHHDHDDAGGLVPHEEPAKMLGTMELYAKAPNKRLVITNIEGVGEIRQGFDGRVGWNQTPEGITEITGEALENMRREAVFNGALKWREMYPKAELKGKEKIGGRDTYAILLTPKSGRPLIQYIDTETFLMAGQSGTVDTEQGPVAVRTEMSDYRDIGNGVKVPFRLKQVMTLGHFVITMTEVKANVPIDDAKFAKPAN